ncbi:MAG: hypothetical protein ACR2N7_04575 [Acidimicrobiia bacterium]
MRRMITVMAMAAVMLVATASVAIAGSPTCENQFDSGWKNHGSHVTGDYAQKPGEPRGARGGPAHFGNHPLGASPGATFCNPGNNQAPEVLVWPNGNVITHGTPTP